MSTPKGSTSNSCHCWIPVVATVLILFSIFDSGFAILMGSFAEVLLELSHRVHEHGAAMKVGKFFSAITGGSINIGDFSEGTVINEMVKDLPELWLLATLAWIRLGFSFTGLVLGCFMAFRREKVFIPIMLWAIASIAFGIFAIISSWDIYRVLAADAVPGDAILLGTLDFGLHIIWPLFLISRLWFARRN
jgi:hypothetical protein